MTTSISFYSGGGAYYAPQAAPQQENVLLEVGEIVAPIEYFENAERTYAAKQDTLSIEMMCKAVQAYVQQRPGCTREALDLAERMPEVVCNGMKPIWQSPHLLPIFKKRGS